MCHLYGFKACEKISTVGLMHTLCTTRTVGSVFPGFLESNSVIELVSQFVGGK